jgi:predicted acetyltransferase
MSLVIRTLTESDADAMLAVDGAAFSELPAPAEREPMLATTEWDRMFGAFLDGTLCGITGAYGVDVTVPGLAGVPTSGVTAVGVLPTHRRRGVVTALMAHQLDDVVARGEPLAILNASEATIYERFGYGVASVWRQCEISRARSAFATPVAEGLPLRMLSRDEAVKLAPSWFEAYRSSRPGEINRPDSWWPAVFGEHLTWKGGGPMLIVGCEPDDPTVPGGYAIYRVNRDGPAGAWRLMAREVVAADAEVAAALWRFLLDVDLVHTVVAEAMAPDDPLRWRLADWRAMQVTREQDYLWVRLLDVAAALAARRYRTHDALVVEVADAFRPSASGRYRVEGDASGAQASRVEAEPDLTMDIATLGSLYLGGISVSALARAGRLRATRAGVLERAELFFGSDPGPFCITHF